EMKEQRPPSGMWSLYKQGGIPPAIRSVFQPRNAQQMAFLRQVMKKKRSETAMETPLAEAEVVVFDLETTGFNAEGGDEILSIGAVAAKGEQIMEEQTFYSLVNPGRPIPPAITELTGIRQAEVEQAPGI